MGKVPRDGGVKKKPFYKFLNLSYSTQCCMISYGWLFDLLSFHRDDSLSLLLVLFREFLFSLV